MRAARGLDLGNLPEHGPGNRRWRQEGHGAGRVRSGRDRVLYGSHAGPGLPHGLQEGPGADRRRGGQEGGRCDSRGAVRRC